MALPVLPSYLKVTDARLRVVNATDTHQSEINRRNPAPAALREVWFLESAFAPLNKAQAGALSAWIEALDGRVNAFKLPLTQGVYGATCSGTVALSATATRGAGVLPVTVTGTIPAGTLIGVGDIETDTYQLFEVSEAATSATTSLAVAPRVRHAFTSGAAVSISTAYGKFNLSEDGAGGVAVLLDRTGISLSAVEAV